MTNSLSRRCIAEFIGTFALLFVGCGAAATNAVTAGETGTGLVGLVGISLAFGLIVTAMVYSLGGVSGAHINPVVTLAMTVQRKFSMVDTVAYIVAQVAGAVFAAVLLNVIFPEIGNIAVTNPISDQTVGQAFAMEVILTFFLIYIVLQVTSASESVGMMAGIVIGGAVAMEVLVGAPISGASMNPARSIGPALISGDVRHLWIYIVAPPIGSLIAVGGHWLTRDETPGEVDIPGRLND